MSPRFVLGRENVPCVAEVVNRSLKADCTDFTFDDFCVCVGTRLGQDKWPGNQDEDFSQSEFGTHAFVLITNILCLVHI